MVLRGPMAGLSSSPHSERLFLSGEPLRTSPSCGEGKGLHRKQTLITAKKLWGLQEAIRIKRYRNFTSFSRCYKMTVGTSIRKAWMLLQWRTRELRDSAKVRKRPPLRRGKVSGPLPVPDHILKPPYVGTNILPEISSEFQVHDDEGIACMRASCELAARVLEYAGTLVKPSITTNEIDEAVHEMIIGAGAYPSPLGYGGFPKSVCTSVNECMCHGIPDSRQLQDGDIINIDVTVYLNGYHGDTSRTFFCGNVDEPTKQLVKVAEECMMRAISRCKDGARFNNIGKIISEHAEKFGYNVVEQFVGHGVGKNFHSEPIIFHHRNDKPGRMVEGQTFTIEPILTTGSIECVMWDDGWTALTKDGSPAAQFEHTLLITKTGAEILTKC